MKNILIIFNNEIKRFLYRPYIYFVTALFFLMTGLIVSSALNNVSIGSPLSLNSIYSSFFIFIVFFTPLLALHSFSDERVYNTYELLYSSPITMRQFVYAKFGAFIGLLKLMFFFTLIYAIILHFVSTNGADLGKAFVMVVGNIFLGIWILSIALFCSCIIENIMLSIGATYFIVLFSIIGDYVINNYLHNPGIEAIITELFPMSHLKSFSNGIISLIDVVYFIFFCYFMLILSTKFLEIKNLRK